MDKFKIVYKKEARELFIVPWLKEKLIQYVPIKRFCYESSVGKPCAFTGKACSDFKCVDRADGLRVRYIKIDHRVYVSKT